MKGFRFLFCRQLWKVNFAFLQFQLLRQISFIWHFDVPYFFQLAKLPCWCIYSFSKSMVNFSCYKSRCPLGFISIAHDLFPILNQPAGQVSRLARATCFCFVSSCDCCWGMTRHAKLTAHVSSLEWYRSIYRDIWRYMVHDLKCSLKLLKIRWPKMLRVMILMVPYVSQIIQLWAPGSDHAAGLWNGEPTCEV